MLFSYENMYRQYLACRHNKRNTASALKFEARQELGLLELKDALENRTYSPSRSVCFLVRKPKLREVFAADFRDRVVHHVLVDHLQRIWEPIFIHDSYACRTGKGVHAGVARLRTFIRRVTVNGTRPAWYLQLDIHNYFMRIDKQILFDLLAPRIRDEDALWLTRLLVFHDCTDDFVFKGDATLHDRLPKHKTLSGNKPGKGLPIGNLNSQFFANVYLDRLDQFVKHSLKCRHYLRYCDDFVLVSDSRGQLERWREEIRKYLREHLQLELNDRRGRLRPVSDGIDFLGYIVRADYLLVRRRVVGNLRERLQAHERQLVRQGRLATCFRYDPELVEELRARLSSYLGHLRKANAHRLSRAMWRRFSFLDEYLVLDDSLPAVRSRHEQRRDFRLTGQQYVHFRDVFPDDVVLMQVGAFMEMYAPDPTRSPGATLGLEPMRPTRRGARHGFPTSQLARRLLQLLASGRSVTVVVETGAMAERVLDRQVRRRYLVNAAPKGMPQFSSR